MNEHQVLLAWRQLFQSKQTSNETLVEAEALLEGLSGESPLHLRLAKELEELKRRSSKHMKQPTRRRIQ